MLTETSPVEDALAEIEQDIHRASENADPWNDPQGEWTGWTAATTAVRTLRVVQAAVADLEPGAAIIITEAFERGLGLTR